MPPLQSQAGGFVRRPLDFCHDEALEATGSHPVFTAGCDGWLNSRHEAGNAWCATGSQKDLEFIL